MFHVKQWVANCCWLCRLEALVAGIAWGDSGVGTSAQNVEAQDTEMLNAAA